jgi:hypothetical protein
MFDPYHKWLGIPKEHRPPTHYQLLGVTPTETDPEVIDEAAVRQTTHVRAYQMGEHSAASTRLLNEISQAKLTLLNPAKRRAYDARLAAERGSQITAQTPVASAAPAAAFQFESDDGAPIARPPARPSRDVNIARPATSAPSGLVLVLAIGGGLGFLLVVAVLVMFFMRSARQEAAPVAVAGKAGKGKEIKPILKIPEQNEPEPPIPRPMPQPPVQPMLIAPQPPRLVPPGDVLQVQGKVTADDPNVMFKTRVGMIQMHARWHEVKLAAKTRYRIDLQQSGGVWDPYLIVQDDADGYLDHNDDGGERLNSRLVFIPAKDGTYKMYAAALGERFGEYVLSISSAGQAGAGELASQPPGLQQVLTRRVFGAHRVRFAPDGKTFFTGGLRGERWGLDGALLQTYWKRSSAGDPFQLSVTHDAGRLLWAYHQEPVRVHDVATGQELTKLDRPGQRQLIATAPDRDLALVALDDKSVVAWDYVANKVVHESPPANTPLSGLEFSADGKHALRVQLGGVAQWVATSDWSVVAECTVGIVFRPSALSKDGSLAMLPTQRNGIWLWSPATKQFKGNLPVADPHQVAACAQGKLVVVRLNQQPDLQLWDVERRLQLARWAVGDHVNTFDVDPEERRLVAVTRQGHVYVWPLPATPADVK